MRFREMPAEEQARHEAAHGRILGLLCGLRMTQRSDYYREAAVTIYEIIAALAEEEARALES